MLVKNVCQQQVACVAPETSVVEAAIIMKEKHVGDLVVVKHPARPRDPIGVLTDRDIVIKAIASGVPLEDLKVADIMTGDPRCALESDSVLKVTEKMEAVGARRLPVVDAGGNLKGIVSTEDLYDLLATEFGNLARVGVRRTIRESAPAAGRPF